MSRTLGQQMIIENVLGAGGTTGSIRAMRANSDGYTIEMGQQLWGCRQSACSVHLFDTGIRKIVTRSKSNGHCAADQRRHVGVKKDLPGGGR
jgi:Tripartite tricarboxylate transporter family receptor